ncbi:MAG TPA: hypothetical protein VHH73_04840, partial [Verrucomicrobiae bacterium]|nr:hypothetical protein [Verrucomicrobiae bacterium]
MKMNRIPLAQLVLLLFLPATSARLAAATNGFVVPTFRGATNSQTGYWEIFTVASGAPGNKADQAGATTRAALTQTDAAAFLTGSGNIYNLGTSAFSLSDSTSYAAGTVVLQIRTVGSETDYGSISLNYANDAGSHTVAPLFRIELDRAAGQGSSVSSLWQWDLSGLGVTNYTVTFHAGGPSLSFDSMTLDTAAAFAPAFASQPFALQSRPATLARWMYAFNANPATRPAASTFAAFGSLPDFDTRDAQYLVGWNTSNQIPSGLGARNYLIRRARVTLTIASDNQYTYTGQLRDYRTYFPTNDPRYLPSTTSGSPVELFGAGYRGGFTATTFQQASRFLVDTNGGYYTNRTAYAAGFDTNGTLVDVSNNVADDGTNEIATAFEVAPFAVGQSAAVAPGQPMPAGSKLTFDLNLNDPLIYSYVQQGLDQGNLNFVASTLLGGSFSGAPNYPNFYTIFSP